MSYSDWSNKSFLVAGASSAIGQDVCLQILKGGGKVTALTRNESSLAQLRESFTSSLKILPIDLSEVGSSQFVAKEITEKLSGFVYCAGVLSIAPIKFYKHTDFNKLMRINCEAFLELTQALLRKSLLAQGSSIVAVSSNAEKQAIAGNGIYAASKAALAAAARVLALEVARDKIRVNTVAPGALNCGMTKQVEASLSTAVASKHASDYPLGSGTAADVSNLILFLLSPASHWITGTSSVIDGGYSCR